jgi:hypothetical protein
MLPARAPFRREDAKCTKQQDVKLSQAVSFFKEIMLSISFKKISMITKNGYKKGPQIRTFLNTLIKQLLELKPKVM